MYVLRQRDRNQIEAYSTEDFTLEERFTVPRLQNTIFTDLAACESQRCLYMADCGRSCVHRFGLSHPKLAKWGVMYIPWGVAVTPAANVLVTCRDEAEKAKLVVLDGQLGHRLRLIALDSAVDGPWHSLQLSSGTFVMGHGDLPINSRLLHLDSNGGPVRSNSGDGGLQEPRHVAADPEGFVFVADSFKKRIVLFDPSLKFVRDAVSDMRSRPEYLCFDEARRRLYVSQSGGIVIVVQL